MKTKSLSQDESDLRGGTKQQDFFETLFALARLGKTDARGGVNLLQLAVIGSEIESQTFGAGIPISLQRLSLRVLAGLGRRLGYQARCT